jgi:hypothetical protein
MNRVLLLALPLALASGGCSAKVSHPTKSLAEQQVDIDLCSDQANRKYWMDPIAALYNAYDCLEAKGYQRGDRAVAAKVEKAVAEPVGGGSANGSQRAGAASAGPAAPTGAAPLPCRVPCKPKG